MSMWVSIGYVETESAVKLFGDCAWTRKWESGGSWWELVGAGENKARAFCSQQRKASPGTNNSEKACMRRFEWC